MEGLCSDDSAFVAVAAAVVDLVDSIRVDAETCSLPECSLGHSYTVFGIHLAHLVHAY